MFNLIKVRIDCRNGADVTIVCTLSEYNERLYESIKTGFVNLISPYGGIVAVPLININNIFAQKVTVEGEEQTNESELEEEQGKTTPELVEEGSAGEDPLPVH